MTFSAPDQLTFSKPTNLMHILCLPINTIILTLQSFHNISNWKCSDFFTMICTFRHWLLDSTYFVSIKTLTRTRKIWNISSSIGYYFKSNHNSLLYNLFVEKKNENGRNLLFKSWCAYMYEYITLYYLILIRMGPEHFQQYDRKNLRWPRSVIFFK